MAKISRSSKIPHYKTVGANPVRSVKGSAFVENVFSREPVHNTPDHSSGNEHYIVDAFYSKIHHLMSEYLRIQAASEEDEETMRRFFESHPEAIQAGAEHLVAAINTFIADCEENFSVTETEKCLQILRRFKAPLEHIGITLIEHRLHLDFKYFYKMLLEAPLASQFLFETPNGLVDTLSQYYYALRHDDQDASMPHIIDLQA